MAGNCCQNAGRKCQQIILGSLEKFFYKYGYAVARYPLIFIVVCIVFVCLCGIGFTVWESRDDGDVWFPDDMKFKKDSAWLEENFPSKTRFNQLLIKSEDNILTANNIRAIYDLHKRILAIKTPNGSTWDKICMKVPIMPAGFGVGGAGGGGPPSYPEDICAGLAQVANLPTRCAEFSILELWGENGDYNNAAFTSLTDADVLNKINSVNKSGIFGTEKNFRNMIGDVVEENGDVKSAKVMKMQFLAEFNETLVEDKGIESDLTYEWEEYFINLTNKDFTYPDKVKGYPNAARSFGDTGQDAGSDMQLLMVGYVVVFIFVMFNLGKVPFLNSVSHRVVLSMLGIVTICIGGAATFGFCQLCGLWYGGMLQIMPLLLLGIGIDDMFVIVQSFENLDEKEKLEERKTRFGLTLKHAGVAITITSVTDLVAFGISASTVIPMLQIFCAYAAIGIFFVFIFMVTFFFAWFSLDQRRMEDTRDGCLCCWKKSDDWKPCADQKSLLKIVFGKYADLLVKWPVKLAVFLLTLLLIGLSAWGTASIEPDFDPIDYLNQDSYLIPHFRIMSESFPSSGMYGEIKIAEVPDIHTKLKDIQTLYEKVKKLEDTVLVKGETKTFLLDFFDFVNGKVGSNEKIPENDIAKDKFQEYLTEFLFTVGQSWRDSVKFAQGEKLECGKAAPNIKMMTIAYSHRSYENAMESIDGMKKVSDLADAENYGGNSKVFAFSAEYGNLVLMDIIVGELYRNIGLAMLCVFIVSLILIADILASVMVLISVALTFLDVIGFMYHWGLAIDTVAVILLTISLGLAVDYSAHIAHAFMTLTGTRNERARTSLVEMGPAVLNGGLSTFLAFAPLIVSKSFIFQTFFKVFFLVVLFGVFHGLIFLPVLLSLIGPGSTNHSVEPEESASNKSRPITAVSAAWNPKEKEKY